MMRWGTRRVLAAVIPLVLVALSACGAGTTPQAVVVGDLARRYDVARFQAAATTTGTTTPAAATVVATTAAATTAAATTTGMTPTTATTAAATSTAATTPAASATGSATATTPTATGTVAGSPVVRINDTRSLVSIVLPSGWMVQPQEITSVLTLALAGPGTQALSMGVIDDFTDLDGATRIATDVIRSDASTITVTMPTSATVGGERANTFTYTAHAPSDPTITLNVTQWVVAHGGRVFIIVARGAASDMTDAAAIVSSLMFLESAAASTATPTTSTTPATTAVSTAAASATAKPATGGPVVSVTDTDPVNVRAKPSTDSAIVVQIAAGDDADVTEASVPGTAGGATWIHVAYKGFTGYVRADVVSAPHPKMAGTATPRATSAARTTVPATATPGT